MKCQAMSTLLDENMTCEFKCKNSFTLSKPFQQSKRKAPCSFDAVFSSDCKTQNSVHCFRTVLIFANYVR